MESVEELCDNITLINKAKTILEGKVDDIRRQWAANEYEIMFEGDINLSGEKKISILSRQNENGRSRIRFKSMESIETNDILDYAIRAGKVISFNPVLPSMNEIFIRVVESRN
jgi:ABC-2 type transport system ATP-binding protein